MNLEKTGNLIKELRKEKGLTQEKLAEEFNVSRRTVSRWETGSNLPDLDILIDMSDYFDVDLRELLDGERKSEKMNKELEETVLKVAEYSNEDKNKLAKKMTGLFIVGIVAFTAYVILSSTGIAESTVGGNVADFILGVAYGIMILGLLYTSGCLIKMRNSKKRLVSKILKK